MFGFGSGAVRSVGVDEQGQMRADLLDVAVEEAKSKGETPFYVNATAGTTVLGSYDPIDKISPVCKKHNLWLHVDGSWGGPVIFSPKNKYRLKGIEHVDSIGVTPHKMLAVPMTCSFLLGADMRSFQSAMTLPAGYLFHDNDDDADDTSAFASTDPSAHPSSSSNKEIWDLADLTPQCGRRGDSLKLALSWIYYGSSGFETLIDTAFANAAHLASLIAANKSFTLVSSNPPPCLQVCFYYDKKEDQKANSKMTEEIARKLIPRGWMIDYAPGDEGRFFRVVVNGGTRKSTLEGLVKAIEEVGRDV